MPLTVVSDVIANGGYLPQLAALEQLNFKKPFFSKKNGVLFGLIWFIILTMFLPAVFGILNAPDSLIGITAVTGVFGAMMIIIGSLMVLPSSKPPIFYPVHAPTQMPGAAVQTALPPQREVPATGYAPPRAGSWRDTNDLVPSATESTTRLLKEEENR
ncbi:MAG: hypothetical protein JO053_02195 [Acidobacteria bacterium]|nr:hypothetical protein [Acidobacteriota bacterium]